MRISVTMKASLPLMGIRNEELDWQELHDAGLTTPHGDQEPQPPWRTAPSA